MEVLNWFQFQLLKVLFFAEHKYVFQDKSPPPPVFIFSKFYSIHSFCFNL